MNRNARLVVWVLAVAAAIGISAPPALAQPANVVIEWNRTLQALTGPALVPTLRALPMLHVAMFDAINSIEDIYTPYRIHVKGAHGASAEAAAAQAARDVLTAVFPAQLAMGGRLSPHPIRPTYCH
jgi:hypothetical protein